MEGMMNASDDRRQNRGRAMSLTLCVDELDLKMGKRGSVSSSQSASPTNSFMPGRDCPLPKESEESLSFGQSGFSRGMPLSFARHCDPVAEHGKRRRLGDPM
jgi:hypothetical protein